MKMFTVQADLPVICISGYAEESVLQEVEAIENVYFLPKPFSLKQLAGKVKEALTERQEKETIAVKVVS